MRMSRTELERRWSLLRAYMEERQIDALIASGSDTFMHGSYAKWLTGAGFGYTVAIIFTKTGAMTRFEHGHAGETLTLDGRDERYPGVELVIRSPEFFGVSYAHRQLAADVASELKSRGYHRIGLLGPERMTHGMVSSIEAAVAGTAEITDETEFLDGLIAVKGPEEIALLKANIAIQVAAFDTLLRNIRPGMRDIDALNLVRGEAMSRGGTGGMCEMGSAPPDRPSTLFSRDPQRVMEKGDALTVLLETSGPDGYFTQMGRTIVLGRATNELLDNTAICVEAMAVCRSLVKPGGSFHAVLDAYNACMEKVGMPPERRVLGHGQGYDVVQRPLVRQDESMPIAENMFLAMHPWFERGPAIGWMCDNILVEQGGASDWLHGFPQQVYEVDV